MEECWKLSKYYINPSKLYINVLAKVLYVVSYTGGKKPLWNTEVYWPSHFKPLTLRNSERGQTIFFLALLVTMDTFVSSCGLLSKYCSVFILLPWHSNNSHFLTKFRATVTYSAHLLVLSQDCPTLPLTLNTVNKTQLKSNSFVLLCTTLSSCTQNSLYQTSKLFMNI